MSQHLTKEGIQSLIGSVFVMQSINSNVEFKVGRKYRFEMDFLVREEHLELEGGAISLVKEAQSDGYVEPEPNT